MAASVEVTSALNDDKMVDVITEDEYSDGDTIIDDQYSTDTEDQTTAQANTPLQVATIDRSLQAATNQSRKQSPA